MSSDAMKMHILHTPIIFVECIVMKRSSESISVWNVAAHSRALLQTKHFSFNHIRGGKKIDFHSLQFFETLVFCFFPPSFFPSFLPSFCLSSPPPYLHISLLSFPCYSKVPLSLLLFVSLLMDLFFFFPVYDFQSFLCFPLRETERKSELDASLLSLPH